MHTPALVLTCALAAGCGGAARPASSPPPVSPMSAGEALSPAHGLFAADADLDFDVTVTDYVRAPDDPAADRQGVVERSQTSRAVCSQRVRQLGDWAVVAFGCLEDGPVYELLQGQSFVLGPAGLYREHDWTFDASGGELAAVAHKTLLMPRALTPVDNRAEIEARREDRERCRWVTDADRVDNPEAPSAARCATLGPDDEEEAVRVYRQGAAWCVEVYTHVDLAQLSEVYCLEAARGLVSVERYYMPNTIEARNPGQRIVAERRPG